MTVIIEYATISPAVLNTIITKATCNALCTWRDIDEEFFEFEVMGWLPLTITDLAKIERILARYVQPKFFLKKVLDNAEGGVL